MPGTVSWFVRRSLSIVALFVVAVASIAGAEETYRLPPQPIVDILDAPETPSINIDPHAEVMVLVEKGDLPPIADLAQPMLRLGGYRLNPATNGNFTTSFNKGYTLQRINTGATTAVSTPAGARLGEPSWAPDGSSFVFLITRDNGIELWVADATGGLARKLTEAVINECGDAPAFKWMPDSRHLVARVVPNRRGDVPEVLRVPIGPVVQENIGRTAPVRTYQDLLQNPHDEAMFDYLMTSQVVLVDVQEARDTYATISPFMHADKINEPILLIHGEIDNNSGTFPMQSERMYHAIKGHGGTVRYVVLPYESHGYRARESVLHTLAEMVEWLDRYVKNATVGASAGGSSAGGSLDGD